MENDVNVWCGLAEVVASDTVIAFQNHPITITFGPADDRLTAVFEFTDDEGRDAKSNEFRYKTENPERLKLSLRNFKSPLGSGLHKPLRLGTLSGVGLYLNFRVYQLVDSDKTLHYAFYRLDEEAEKKATAEGVGSAMPQGPPRFRGGSS